jgi:hypothetical protein
MGFSSVVLFSNDQIDKIDDDPAAWWKQTRNRLASGAREVRPDHFGTQVVSVAHQSTSIMVGTHQGIGYIIGAGVGGGPSGYSQGPDLSTEDGQVALLRDVALSHGYRLMRAK